MLGFPDRPLTPAFAAVAAILPELLEPGRRVQRNLGKRDRESATLSIVHDRKVSAFNGDVRANCALST
jgi:hypothetical protein